MDSELYYRHSGRFPTIAAPFGVIVGATGGGLLAFAYAYAVLYCPIVYVNLLICGVYGWLVGFMAARSMAWLNVRNANVMRGASLLAAAVSFYIAWVAWIYALLQRSDVDVLFWPLAYNPKVLWSMILAINERGVWSIGRRSSENVTGLVLWVVWAAEAMIVFGATLLAVGKVLSRPFCEQCQKWCRPAGADVLVATGQLSELKQRMEAKDFTCLQQLGAKPTDATAWYALGLCRCPSCDETTTLSAKQVTTSVDDKGKTSTDEDVIFTHLLLSADETAAYLATSDAVNAAGPHAAAEQAVGASTEAASPAGSAEGSSM
ncbi:MAG: hypothetical protein AMXMBFR13_31080 [Phycisphaerae bacterium]